MRNKFIKGLLVYGIITVCAGCTNNMPAQTTASVEVMYASTKQGIGISVYCSKFRSENGRWPVSVEELKTFYLQTEDKEFIVDWDKFTDVSLQPLPDGSLKMTYSLQGLYLDEAKKVEMILRAP